MNQIVADMLQNNLEHAAAFEGRFDEVQESQHPETVTVCCSDSRVLQDRIWGNDEPGRIFTCANIGNRVVQQTASGEAVSGDVLYPVEHTATETAIVVGHTGCGAVTAAYDTLRQDAVAADSEPPGIAHCLDILMPRLEAGVDRLPADLDHDEAVNRLVEYNVDRQVEFLLNSDEVSDDVTVVGAVYDFQDVYSEHRGKVQIINTDGETDVETLRDDNPEVEDRIQRIWEY